MGDIQRVLDAINKQLKYEAVHFMTPDYVQSVKTYSSGSLTLDLALGIGGIPQGRIIEIYGPSMSGKSTIAMLHAAQVQQAQEGYVAWVDAEHAFDPKLAQRYGVQLDELIYIKPKTGEQAIDAVDALIRSGDVRLVVVDSVSALLPAKIAESSIEQQTIGLLARFMSATMQKLTPIASLHDCTIIFINQIREKIGAYGNPETTTGGRALPFYSSIRLNVRMGDQLKDKNGTVYGHLIKVN